MATAIRPTAQCRKCGFEWLPRVVTPKECPECKTRNPTKK